MHSIGYRLLLGALALTLVGAGCSPSSSSGDISSNTGAETSAKGSKCGPLKVVVDGEEVTNLTHGVAYTLVNKEYRTEEVDLYNHDQVTCEDALDFGYQSKPGEQKIGAFARDAQGLNTDAYTWFGVQTKVSKQPAGVGEEMTICVDETTFTPDTGVYTGKELTISGSFTGTYCGDKIYAQ